MSVVLLLLYFTFAFTILNPYISLEIIDVSSQVITRYG